MQRHVARSALARYGIAVLSSAAAIVLALWLRPVTLVAGQLSMVAILITGWVCGLRPALAAWGLTGLAFVYFFTTPVDSFRNGADQVALIVQDTGVGIASNVFDDLFTAFFTTKPRGMGMGLSISGSIVEAHEGRLWAVPNEPCGAIFHFSLPIALT